MTRLVRAIACLCVVIALALAAFGLIKHDYVAVASGGYVALFSALVAWRLR